MRIFLLTISIVIILFSCTTEFDVNDEWSDNTVIYALLNINDSPNYVKINKAFLGEADALEMATVSDSFNYKNLNVYMEEWKDGNYQKTIPLQKTNEIQKEPGLFAIDNNILYKVNENLSENTLYKLVIKNLENGNEVTAETEMVGNFKVEAPLYIISGQTVDLDFYGNSPVAANWRSAYNGRIYYIFIHFYYTEILFEDTTYHSIIYPLNPTISDEISIDGWSPDAQRLTKEIDADEFYKFIASAIEPKENVRRKFNYMDFKFVVGSDDFYTYLQVNEPSTSIVQERPTYSNILNGIGLFTSRYTKMVYNKKMSGNSLDSLSFGRYSKLLRFEDKNGNIH